MSQAAPLPSYITECVIAAGCDHHALSMLWSPS